MDRLEEIRERVRGFRENERAETLGGFYDDTASLQFRSHFMADFMWMLERVGDLETPARELCELEFDRGLAGHETPGDWHRAKQDALRRLRAALDPAIHPTT